MSTLIKSTAIGAVLCGTFTATAFANEVNTLIPFIPEVPFHAPQWQESLVALDFYQGDFQQLGRAMEKSTDAEIMYKGVNSIQVPTVAVYNDV